MNHLLRSIAPIAEPAASDGAGMLTIGSLRGKA